MNPLYADQAHRDQHERLGVKRICAEAWLKRLRPVEKSREVPLLLSEGSLSFLFRRKRGNG
jgi:hypothetical protein